MLQGRVSEPAEQGGGEAVRVTRRVEGPEVGSVEACFAVRNQTHQNIESAMPLKRWRRWLNEGDSLVLKKIGSNDFEFGRGGTPVLVGDSMDIYNIHKSKRLRWANFEL
jgi:hypothetical protein